MPFLQLIDAYQRDVGWVNFQIESFNQFVNRGMQGIIDEVGEVTVDPEGGMKFLFGRVSIEKPSLKEADSSTRTILPNESRIRNLTYSAPIFVEITPVVNGIQGIPEKVQIGELPVMVKSKLCNTHGMNREDLIEQSEDPDDPGGYFIINGTERVLILIEEITSNKPIFEKKKGMVVARLNSERSGFRQRHVMEMKPNGEITISFANLKKLQIITLLKALGMETDKEICEAITSNQKMLSELFINFYECEATTTEEAIDGVGKKLKVSEDYRKERVSQILDKYLLPHIGQKLENRKEKAVIIANMVKKMTGVYMGMIPKDDIDHYSNKRLLMSGELLGLLFRSILLGRWGLLAKMSYNYQKLVKRGKKPSIQGIVETSAVTKQILSSLATGNWIGGRSGVSQRLDRSSYIKTVSHLRSVVSPLTSTQEHFNARQVHPTEWGRICPAETPEGSSIGLRKHLAMFSEITTGLPDAYNEKILKFIGK